MTRQNGKKKSKALIPIRKLQCSIPFYSLWLKLCRQILDYFIHSILFWVLIRSNRLHIQIQHPRKAATIFSLLCHLVLKPPPLTCSAPEPKNVYKKHMGSHHLHTRTCTHTHVSTGSICWESGQLKRKNEGLHRLGENLFSGIFVCENQIIFPRNTSQYL